MITPGKLTMRKPEMLITKGKIGPSQSVPPKGFFKVTNLYVNTDGKLVILYDDNPVE